MKTKRMTGEEILDACVQHGRGSGLSGAAGSTCPHCGGPIEPTVEQIVEILNYDGRRDIYEIGGRGGKGIGRFTISYPNGRKMPRFSLEKAQAVARTGIVYQDPACPGWFRRF